MALEGKSSYRRKFQGSKVSQCISKYYTKVCVSMNVINFHKCKYECHQYIIIELKLQQCFSQLFNLLQMSQTTCESPPFAPLVYKAPALGATPVKSLKFCTAAFDKTFPHKHAHNIINIPPAYEPYLYIS